MDCVLFVQDVMKKLDNIEDSNTRLQKATARLCRNLHLEREQPIYRYTD